MEKIFSDRIADVPRSFIREILKVAISSNIISFAGGLPNRKIFPVDELKEATLKVFDDNSRDAFQYSNSEGLIELREFISNRYRNKYGIDVDTKNILITNGSQQGLDLIGKIFLNENEDVIIEEPAYLGAIQAFSAYRAKFSQVKLENDGLNIEQLSDVVNKTNAKIMYVAPNFQNPSGITYSMDKRIKIAEILKSKNTFLIEDDPYGELRYTGQHIPSFKTLLPEKTIMLGSFSKTVVPGFRLGWIIAPDNVMEKILIAKQASDLHTSAFGQKTLLNYLQMGKLDEHISKIKSAYNAQREAMINAIRTYFPENVERTEPEGGMFLWVTLPPDLKAIDLFHAAIKKDVAFVPGDPFYTDNRKSNTLRLNFSCVDEEGIKTGIERLGKAIKELI